MREEVDYSLDCLTRKRTAVLSGVVRLDHEATIERLFSRIEADLRAGGCEPYTIDVSTVVFMNSSAIRALASLVLIAKRSGLQLTVIGRDSVPWQSRTLRSLSSLYEALEIRLVRTTKPALHRERDLWVLEAPDGRSLRLRDSKGLAYLELLFNDPGRDVHVLELAGLEVAGAAVVVDASNGGAVTPEGRNRRSTPDVERTRVNVQRCIKEALERIGEADAALGRYLSATVRTGTRCSFRPL